MFNDDDLKFVNELVNSLKYRHKDVRFKIHFSMQAEILINNNTSLFISKDKDLFKVILLEFVDCEYAEMDSINKLCQALSKKGVIRFSVDKTLKLYPELIYFLDKINIIEPKANDK